MAAIAYKKKYLQDSTEVNPEKGPWLINLDAPSLIPFLENSQRQDLRKKLYEAHMNKASKKPYDNKQILKEILNIFQILCPMIVELQSTESFQD